MEDSWKVCTLGDVCSFENGDRGTNYPSRSAQTSSGIPFINAGHLGEGGIDIDRLNYIPRTRFDLLSNGKIRPQDILFCLRGSLGKFASVGDLQEGAIASSLVIVRPKSTISPEFLLAYFKSDLCASMITKYKSGTAQPNLSAASLRDFVIPVPPIYEQKRIVGILVTAFGGIMSAAACNQKALLDSDGFLAAWRESQLISHARQSTPKTLEEVIANTAIGLSRNSKEQGAHKEYAYVKMANITRHNKFDPAEMTNIDASMEEAQRFRLKEGDLLFNTRNSYELVGKACLFEPWDNSVVLFNNNIMRIRFKKEVLPAYIHMLLSSENVIESLQGMKSGTTNVSAIYYSQLRSLTLNVPPLPTQIEFIAKWAELSREKEKLDCVNKQKLLNLKALRRSVLNEAFSGTL